MATTAARPNTHDMVVVHRVFRREFRLMPALVRSVTPGDLGRAKTVANHATELTVALHHHHTGEDELLWPRLRERVDLGNVLDADLIDRMEAAHHEIATLLDQAGPMMPQLAARADESTRDELAQVFDQVSPALDAHLAEEEERILPIAEQHLSVEEWAELGARGMASIPKDRMLVFLGHILEETTPQERAEFLGHVPLPGRIAFKLVGQRKYQREVDTLRAGIPNQRPA